VVFFYELVEMQIIQKSRPPVTLDISESGELTARDIYGNPVPLRMGDKLRERFRKLARHSSQDLKPGTVMPDGTIYAGISPDTGRAFYAAAQDATVTLDWNEAIKHARKSTAHSYNDWRVPTKGELNVLFNNRAAIGDFNLSGSFPEGCYWSSSKGGDRDVLFQRFSDGNQFYYDRSGRLSVRCVRG
jgi:hypothetical protein